MSLRCTVGYKWVTIMDGIKFEFEDIYIYMLYYINYIIIISKTKI